MLDYLVNLDNISDPDNAFNGSSRQEMVSYIILFNARCTVDILFF